MPATFDGPNLLITLPAVTPEIDAKIDLYSDWKEWFKTSDNSKFPVAFDTTGGDPTTATGNVAAYYFLRNDNGWRIKPAEEDAEVVIVGNLYPRDATLPMFMETTGAFTVLITIERDASSVVETVVAGSGVTQQDKDDIEAQIFAHVVEAAETFEYQLRLIRAEAAGSIRKSGNVHRIRNAADTKDRITATATAADRNVTAVDGT
jgi:hypothetical protein